MRLLLTNDDGVDSPALTALWRRLEREHEVAVIAPDRERSGVSHAITLKRPIRIRRKGSSAFACGGTTADCVMLACMGLCPFPIDLVISGPNLGPNLGTDIIYSGTVAGARQAVLTGVPAVAASLCGGGDEAEIEFAVEFLARNAPALRDIMDPEPDHFVNLNFPARCTGPIRVTDPSLRIYKDELERHEISDQEFYCFVTGGTPHSHPQSGSDWEAVSEGSVSLSPVSIHPVNHAVEDRYRELELWQGE